MRQYSIMSRVCTPSTMLMQQNTRSFFTMQRCSMLMGAARASPLFMYRQQQLTLTPVRDFSLKMRKVREKQKPTRKYRLKTKKAFQKRFRICGSLRNKMFKFQA